jgi:hypothetical protein
MVTAGRGVLLCPRIGLCGRNLAINFHVLQESKRQFELYVIGKKNSEPAATVNNFVRIFFEAVQRLPSKEAKHMSGEAHEDCFFKGSPASVEDF